MVNPTCIGCNTRIRHGQKFKVGEGLGRIFWSARLICRVDPNSSICQTCQLKYLNWKKETNGDFNNFINQEENIQNNIGNDDNEMEVDEQTNIGMVKVDREVQTTAELEKVEELINRTTKCQKSCVVCGADKGKNRRRLTKEQRHLVFLKQGIFVPQNARCCKKHLYNKQLTYEALKEIKATQSSIEMWRGQEVNQCLNNFRQVSKSLKYFDFDDPSSMNDTDYLTITGLNIGDDLAIVCAIINAYGSTATLNVHDDEDIAIKMLDQLTKDNILEKRLIQLEQQKVLKWVKHDGIFCLFPSLTQNDIENITFGSYQIHRAKSYIQEHLKTAYYNENEVTFDVETPEGVNDLVRARFQSGHSNSKSYIATIQFDNNDTINPIQGWCCSCTIGLRVVGCCSHVCALLWHLGVNRGIINYTLNPLSAHNLMDHVKDSIIFSDNDEYSDNDNNIKYSLANDSTDTSSNETSDSEIEED
ncbi:unnamed protein product [Rotaria sordida]|uniref:SWIM-type domain-containing protein n=1 Tax=Rotaria sordida TaxID=392033 RepID=A0A820B0D2_9BILA|nr:unnamed protein product [Rotaria sordida]